MSPSLRFADPQSAADALTFAGRAAPLGDGAVRLQASNGVLVATSAPLAPRGLLDATPLVLGIRTFAVDPELVCDLVVEASALHAGVDQNSLGLPDSAVSAPWAGVSPPRADWVLTGAVSASTLASRAQIGIAEVAQAVPKDAGEDAVRAVRAAVWGRTDDDLDGLPLGVSFAAHALGFIAGAEEAVLRTSGAWSRLTLARGHVLARGPVRAGLTAVRATGAA
jgi:hypothetical protein